MKGDAPEDARVEVRVRATLDEVSGDWSRVSADRLTSAAPWREFRWHRGQKHYSGTYWSSTMAGHVTYESGLELANLVLLDANSEVTDIVSQPFRLTATVDARRRAHVPDFLIVDDEGLLVIDVKPAEKLLIPEVRAPLDWTRVLVERRGWRYEIRSEVDPQLLSTMKFLAGYRNPAMFDEGLVEIFAEASLAGRTVEEASVAVDRVPPAIALAVVFHLVWTDRLGVDMSRPLCAHTVLQRSRA